MQDLQRFQRAKIEQCWTVDIADVGLGIDRRRLERLLHRVVHNYRNPVELDRYGLSEPVVGVGGVMHYGLDGGLSGLKGGSEDSSWTIGYFWRADGVPIWCDPLLMANDRGITSIESGQEFADRLGSILGSISGLTVEVRNGTLYVFLPPMDCELQFLKVVHGIELTAAFLMMPVRLEGFRPPVGDLICGFEITPGLGVVEVNIHPVQPWPELLVLNAILERSATAVGFKIQFSWDGRCLEPIEDVVETNFPSSVFVRSLQDPVTA